MSNYYEALSAAIAELPDASPHTRNEVYERAQKALYEKLRSTEPPSAEADIMREAQLFREAVARLEEEIARRAELVATGQTQPQKPQLTVVSNQARTSNGMWKVSAVPSASQASSSAAGGQAAAEGHQESRPEDQPPAPAPEVGEEKPGAAGPAQTDAARHASTLPARAEPRKLSKGDHEFLPAALEILETPPSPVRIRIIGVICAFVVAGLAWSWFGHFDIVAVAQGKFQPTGRVNVVQPVETGKVRAIRVSNNSRVQEGDVLVEMDSTESQAEVTAQSTLLASLNAEIVRRRTFATVIAGEKLNDVPQIEWTSDIPQVARLREQRVFDSDIAQVRAAIQALQAQRRQKQAELARVEGTIGAQEKFVATLQERVDMRELLVARNAGARANVIDALEKLREQQTQLAQQRGQLKEVTANIAVIDTEIQKIYQNAVADNNQRLLQALRQKDDTEQRLAKAKVRYGNAFLKAPNSGTVQALSVINAGQVVAAGEQIMRVVPDGMGLEIEGYIQNKDIGFIKEGQEAIIKVDSFPFTKYGTIDARVVRIARDAIPLPEAAQLEANPAQSQRATAPGGAQRTQNLVYQVTLQPLGDTIGADGEKIKLMPGMTVTLEIKTGRRRIISYIFTPLVEVGSAAMRER